MNHVLPLIASMLVFTSAARAAEPRTYTLDPARSWLTVLVRYDRSAAMAGHDHVVRASTFEGSVVWDPDHVDACDVRIAFPVSALVVDPPGARERLGLEGDTGEGTRGKIAANLAGKSQLDGARFPTVSFRSTACAPQGDAVLVRGELALHGVAQPVSALLSVTAADTFTAKGSFEMRHVWGFSPYTALFGALRNDEVLRFDVDLRGGSGGK